VGGISYLHITEEVHTMFATAHDDDSYFAADEPTALELELETRAAPFNRAGDFGYAMYNMDSDRFEPQIWLWVEPDHIQKPIEGVPSFVTEREASDWLHAQVGWIELRRDPSAPEPKYETHFCVAISSLPTVVAKCDELGLQLSTSRVTPEQVLSYWGGSYPDQESLDNATARAAKTAIQYVNVHIRAPKAEKQVIAVAKLECGMPVFHTLEGHDERFWTAERIAAVDFKRCDQCGIAHQRVKLFLVRNDDGEIEQYGGACAKHLNLAKLVNDHLRALKALQRFLGGMGDEEWGFGSSKSSDRVDPRFALVLADMMIAEHGYVSGGAAWRSNGELVSTKSHTLHAMSLLLGWTKLGARDQQLKAERARLREKLSEYPEDRAQALYEKAEALVASKLEDELSEFTSNLNVAFCTGSLKLLGFLVWLPSALRKADAAEAKRKLEEKANATQSPWTPTAAERPTNGAELHAFIDTWYDADHDQFCADLGITEGSLKRALGKPDKALTKASGKKLDRTVPGTWTITRIGSFQGDWGTSFFITIVREDGAKVLWKSSNPVTEDGFEVNEGDQIRFKGASIGDIPKPYTNERTGRTSQDGRRVNRATCYRVTS
jgi:hypothetical protein